MLLPCLLVLLLLALQPVCLLYTRAIMEAAAASGARLMVTGENVSDESCRAFVVRQLAAVPNVTIFHAGGPLSWDVEFTHAGEGDAAGAVRVSVRGYVRPLPVLGAFAPVFGATNAQGDVELSVDVSYRARPDWLEGGYDAWIAAWDG